MANNVKRSLDNLVSKDVYSLLMFVLFKSSDVPELAVLSQLIYLLDEENFIKLIKYFGGQKIVVPTLDELRELIYCLTLYKSVEIDKKDFKLSLSLVPEELRDNVVSKFNGIKYIMKEYDFVQ